MLDFNLIRLPIFFIDNFAISIIPFGLSRYICCLSFELIYNYPNWYILLCLVVAAIYSGVLYFKRHQELAKALKIILASVRFIAVAILLFLLLNPLLKYTQTINEKPLIVVGVDNSNSIVQTQDSAFYRKEFQDGYRDFISSLESKFNVATYSIGTQATKGSQLNFTEEQTDLQAFLSMQADAFEGQNVGAVVLASDGIYTKGLNPNYGILNQRTPVHTIKMGDTTVRKDALIASIRSNQIAYLNNTFPVVVDVQVKKAKGEKVTVSLFKNGQKLRSETIEINQNRFSKSLNFQLEAKALGVQGYSVQVSRVSNEQYTSNNQRNFYIEVLNSKQKILLCASATHPDIGALRRGIEENENYELTVKTNELPSAKDIEDNSLIILHQYPASASDLPQLKNLIAKKVPLLFVLGSKTDMNAYGRLKLPLNVLGVRSGMNQSLAALNADFLLFELDEQLKNRFAELPPLFSPFGTYKTALQNNTLFKQKIGVVSTNYPLMYFHNEDGHRMGFIAGEGWWRWRMAEHRTHSNFDATNELLSKTIQYLSIKKDKRKLRVSTRKKSYSENEVITFDAELYNDNYELTNTPHISLKISDEAGKVYPYVFGKADQRYRSSIGRLPAGQYSYEALVNVGGKQEKVQGYLTVKKLEIERINLEANHRLLEQLSQSTQGKSYDKNGWQTLASDLLADKNLVPIRYSNNSFQELLNQKWIFFLLVFLFSLEWFIRKWNSI